MKYQNQIRQSQIIATGCWSQVVDSVISKCNKKSIVYTKLQLKVENNLRIF